MSEDTNKYSEMTRIVQRIKEIEDAHFFGKRGKPLSDETREELESLKKKLANLKEEDDKSLGL